MSTAPPPDDGWYVEIHRPGRDDPLERRPFALPEDAREWAKTHVFLHRTDVAEVIERRAGRIVFLTRIAHPHGPAAG